MPLCQFRCHWPQTLDIRGPFHVVFFFFVCLSINVQIHGKRYHFFFFQVHLRISQNHWIHL